VLRRRSFVVWLALALALAGARPSAANDIDRLIDANHWTRARAAIKARLEAAPDDPVAVRQNAQVLHAFNDLPGAQAQAEHAVKLAPNDPEAHYALAEVAGDQAQHANPLKQLGLAKKFRKEAEQTIVLDPKHIEARLDLISFHYQAPGIAGGDKKKAAVLATEIERIAPDQAWRAKAAIAAQEKDTTALGAIYHEGAARQPNDYRARVTYASWLAAPWHNPAESEAHARAAVALDPGRVEAYTILVVLHAREGHWDQVDAIIDEATAKVPDDLSPVYQAGRIALTEGNDPVRAEHYFRRYLAQPPEAGAVPLAAARWRLGLSLEKQGRKDEALKEIQLANQLDPKFEPAKKDLKRLKS
jgi:tetratricopeptide (TPR) repeat protein